MRLKKTRPRFKQRPVRRPVSAPLGIDPKPPQGWVGWRFYSLRFFCGFFQAARQLVSFSGVLFWPFCSLQILENDGKSSSPIGISNLLLLVSVSTNLKNVGQIGSFPQVGVNMKNI